MNIQSLSRYRSLLAALVLGAGAGAALLVASLGEAQDQIGPPVFAGTPSFADVVEQVSPAVVNIAVTKNGSTVPTFSNLPRFGAPFDEFFEQFRGFEAPPVQGQGSGFIIDPEGFIATNYHVVEGASEVTVTLDSGEQYSATVIGTDPDTDLALIRINNGGRLPALRFGDSDRARVGEWVLAIGNPFGLGGSATAGIISARGRDIRSGTYDDFLQIDAPINSGNSGGPVFNAAGEVIGINTAIFSPNGGNIGIGFAIPSNQAERILDELRDGGLVSRGYLGVEIQSVDERLADALALDRPRGALITGVEPGSAAEDGGIAVGDVITEFNGRDIDSDRTLVRLVGAVQPGETVEVRVWRDGGVEAFDIELGMRPGDLSSSAPRQLPFRREGPPTQSRETLGLTLEDLTDERRAELGLGRDVNGAVVTSVRPGSPAAEQGIQPGDVVRSVNGRPVATADEAASSLSSRAPRNNALVLLHRDGRNRFVAIEPAA